MATTFKNFTATKAVSLVTVECFSCAVVFAMPQYLKDSRLYDGGTFYCPNGHGQVYSRRKDLDAELDQAKQRVESEREYRRQVEQTLHTERKSHASTKGQLTKTRNRILAGVCPDCNRHFQNVEHHMATKHGGPGEKLHG